MQASRPRNTYTAAAIKKARHTPAVTLRPSHSKLRHRKPMGYTMAHPYPSQKFPKIPKISHASATPTQHAHRRSHQKSPAYPCGKSTPESLHPTAPQTLGVYNGAPILSDKSDASATPTQHAHHRCHKKSPAYPHGKSSPEPNQTAAPQTHGVYRAAPIIIL